MAVENLRNIRELIGQKISRRKLLGAAGLSALATACLPKEAVKTADGTATPTATAAETTTPPATSPATSPAVSPGTSPAASPAATDAVGKGPGPEATPGAVGKGPGAEATPEIGEVKLPIWEKGKPIIHSRIGPRGNEIVQQIDVGTFGPDVDAICGFDFKGDIPTGATVISRPATGPVLETRVVFIKRTDLMYVQINDALGGDESHVQKARDLFPTEKEANENLDKIARLHARNSAHTHQKVVYLGDLGRFEDEWGHQERALLNRIIWAQRPAKPAIGIQDSNFVFTRRFT